MYWTLDYSRMDEIVSDGMCRIDATIEAACAELDKLKIAPKPTAADVGIESGGTLSGLFSHSLSQFRHYYWPPSPEQLYAQRAMTSNSASRGRLVSGGFTTGLLGGIY